MPHAPIALNLDQALDVQVDLAAEIAFDTVFLVDDLAQPVHLVLGQQAHAGIGIDVAALQDLAAGRRTDAEDVGERRFHPLVA